MHESPDREPLDPLTAATKAVDLRTPRGKTGTAFTEARLRILFYGRLAEVIGRHVELDMAGGGSVADVRSRLAAIYPAAAHDLRRSRAMEGSAFVGDDQVVGSGGELEMLPPVSGG